MEKHVPVKSGHIRRASGETLPVAAFLLDKRPPVFLLYMATRGWIASAARCFNGLEPACDERQTQRSLCLDDGPLAQLVEQRPFKAWVDSSSLSRLIAVQVLVPFV